MNLPTFLSRLERVTGSGNERQARCPAHEDKTASLSVTAADDGKLLLHCHAGCDTGAVLQALGLGLEDLFPPKPKRKKRKSTKKLKVVAAYDYRDANGKLVYQACRLEPKNFRQRRPGPNKDKPWIWSVKGCTPVPYRLPEILASTGPVHICEGEKDVDNLWAAGLPATCNAGGAGKWLDKLSPHLKDRDVVILPDNDEPGRKHAEQVALSLAPYAASIKVVALPGLPLKGDVSDWLEAGGTPEQLQVLVASSPLWKPASGRTAPCSDAANAERLSARHGSELRYNAQLGQWLIWDGRRWQPDLLGRIVQRALDTVREIEPEAHRLAAAGNAKGAQQLAAWGANSQNVGKITGMIQLARSLPELAVIQAQVDADPWLLACNNGTLDLHTGKLRPSRKEDLITRLAPVDYDEGAECPLWEAFLLDIMAGSAELVAFLQRAVGYTLTGDTREECIFILWGNGANGKSKFIETIRAMLCDYARGTPFSTFAQTKGNEDAPRNDLARLDGPRFVTAAEGVQGKPLDEATVKSVAGADMITSRFLNQEFFDYPPQFKVWLSTNHKPRIKGTDEGIWRKLRLVPFTVTFDGKGGNPPPDTDLLPKLRAELPGILAWAVRGCMAWQAEGLVSPPEVLAAIQEYRDEEDVLADWIADECYLMEGGTAQAKALYRNYREWCEEHDNKYPLSQKRWGGSLTSRGCTRKKQGVWHWEGIVLKGDMTDADEQGQLLFMDGGKGEQDQVVGEGGAAGDNEEEGEV